MKKKILIFGWEQHVWETMKNRELKELTEKYDLLCSFYNISALDEIAKAKIQDGNPIRAIVFHREKLVVHKSKCKLIADFADTYSNVGCVCINMITSDGDNDARDYAVSAHFAKQGDWQQVAVILDNNLK